MLKSEKDKEIVFDNMCTEMEEDKDKGIDVNERNYVKSLVLKYNFEYYVKKANLHRRLIKIIPIVSFLLLCIIMIFAYIGGAISATQLSSILSLISTISAALFMLFVIYHITKTEP